MVQTFPEVKYDYISRILKFPPVPIRIVDKNDPKNLFKANIYMNRRPPSLCKLCHTSHYICL